MKGAQVTTYAMSTEPSRHVSPAVASSAPQPGAVRAKSPAAASSAAMAKQTSDAVGYLDQKSMKHLYHGPITEGRAAACCHLGHPMQIRHIQYMLCVAQLLLIAYFVCLFPLLHYHSLELMT